MFFPTIYSLLMAIITIIGCLLLIYTGKLEFKSQIKRLFMFETASSIIWSLGYTLSISFSDLQTKKFMTLIEFIGISTVSPIFFLFVLAYTRDIRLKKNPLTYLIFIPTVIHYFFLVTNEINGGLFYAQIDLYEGLPFNRLELVYGPIFYTQATYNYLLIIVSLIILIQTYISSSKGELYRNQVFLIILGVLIPISANIIRIFRLIPSFQFIDLTPISFILSFIIFYFALYRYGLLVLIPIALERVYQGITDGIVVLDKNFKVMNINNTSLEFFSFSKLDKSIFGQNLFLKVKESEEQHSFHLDLSKIEKELKLIKNNPYKSYSQDFDLKKEERTVKTFNITVSAVEQNNREIIGYILQLKDISERKRVENNIDFLHALLKHDISNKIQVIHGYLKLVKVGLEKSKTGEKENEFIDKCVMVAQESINLIEKIDRIREIDRLDLYNLQKIDIIPIINQVINNYKPRIAEFGGKIEFWHKMKACSIYTGNFLKEMFSNLIENFALHSKGKLLKLTLKDEKNTIELIIEDDGVGIKEEDRNLLFKRGYKGEKSRGSGLGLFLIQRIVEVSNGKINVDKSELGGIKFVISFNRAD